jgi:adenylate cyclase
VDPEIFISHASSDQKVARTICTALENRGLACWISSRNVKPGQNFQEQIVKAIRAAKIMVLVFTANANNSNEIKKELALASQNNLTVIPVRIEDVRPNEAFAYEFATRQWIDLFDNWESSIARLVEQIAAALADDPSGNRAPAGTASTGDAASLKITKAKTATWAMAAAIAAACVAVLAGAAIVYVAIIRPMHQETVQANSAPSDARPQRTVPFRPEPPAPPALPSRHDVAIAPESIPFIADLAREEIRNEYLPAPDHKAVAISFGPIGISTGQADDDTAKTTALDLCQTRANTSPQPSKCELYAVGNDVVYIHGRPPLPPQPWIVRDPSIKRPLVAADIPLAREPNKVRVDKGYRPARASKALVLAPFGGTFFYVNQQNDDEAMRRGLEVCGANAGVPCLILAVGDDFVVPIPMTMKSVSMFRPAGANLIASQLRDELARRLADARGWTAVAAGDSGKFGLALNAENEQAAIDGAMSDCGKQDHACRVVAIGPFAVEPK